MANGDKKSYPMISAKVWWTLRERFKRTIPSSVSSSYLATTLSMTEDSAKQNVWPALRATGLVDEMLKPTELAVKWRDDDQYKEACDTILKNVYPPELSDLGSENKSEVQRWFASKCRVGQSAAGKMAALYWLLLQADPSKVNGASEVEGTPRPRVAKVAKPKKDPPETVTPPSPESPLQHEKKPVSGHAPQIHFDIQIHISPESKPEQIDAIFASMAKHLKELR